MGHTYRNGGAIRLCPFFEVASFIVIIAGHLAFRPVLCFRHLYDAIQFVVLPNMKTQSVGCIRCDNSFDVLGAIARSIIFKFRLLGGSSFLILFFY